MESESHAAHGEEVTESLLMSSSGLHSAAIVVDYGSECLSASDFDDAVLLVATGMLLPCSHPKCMSSWNILQPTASALARDGWLDRTVTGRQRKFFRAKWT